MSCDVNIILFAELPLSMAQPEFKHNSQTFSNCLLLHRLLVTGQMEEEILRRRQELSQSILSHTCKTQYTSKVRYRVGLSFSRLETKFISYKECLDLSSNFVFMNYLSNWTIIILKIAFFTIYYSADCSPPCCPVQELRLSCESTD